MIFQLDYASVITLVMISYLGITLILFVAGVYIMQMYASSKGWDSSFKIPLKLNILLLIINLAVGIPLTFLYGDSVVLDFVRFGINMVVGVIFTIKYYKKDKGESIQFILVIQFLLFIIAVVFGYIFSMLMLYGLSL
ncbi:MAG: hypothetical protein HWN80_04580 [Candidatus Lokiarchaeota archaeon]|nr:hypothetical protein [Candidatus Lokiarchaeota archaeon]